MGRRRGPRAAAVAAIVLVSAACTSNGSSLPGTGAASASGQVHIEFWHGQAGVAQQSLESLIDEFNRTHPDIVVEATSGGATVDNMLPKVTTAIAAGTYPDIAYLFGSWSANIATAEKVVDLTTYVRDPSFGWEDYWPPLREAATVDGRVIGVRPPRGTSPSCTTRRCSPLPGFPSRHPIGRGRTSERLPRHSPMTRPTRTARAGR